MPLALQVMFAKPMPSISNTLNALVTAATCQWLMGKCTVTDVELPTGEVCRGVRGRVRHILRVTGVAELWKG